MSDEMSAALRNLLLSLMGHVVAWWLWLWIMPQIFPAGPAPLVEPGFWLFMGAVVCVSLLRRITLVDKS